jgi:integrase
MLALGWSKSSIKKKLHLLPDIFLRWENEYPHAWSKMLREEQERHKIECERFRQYCPDSTRIHAETPAKIVQAARMRAQGWPWSEVARALGCTIHCAKNWPFRHRELWNEALAVAMRKLKEEVRALAGRKAMLPILGPYVRGADAANRAASEADPLFPHPDGAQGPAMTLRQFFLSYYVPVCMTQPSPKSLGLYEKHLNTWERLTGNPPIGKIDNAMLAGFRDALLKQPHTRKPEQTLSVFTVRSILRSIQVLLDHAGPPCQRNRDAAGIIPAPTPWARMPSGELPERRIVSPEHLSACYQAADKMTVPVVDGVTPPDYWRALLVVGYNLGLRAGSLFGIQWKHVDFIKRLLVIPAGITKTRKRLILPLNDLVIKHLRAIQRQPDDYVFRLHWTTEKGVEQGCRVSLHYLQKLAGVSREARFSLHSLRRTCATNLAASDPAMGTLMLGHYSMRLTLDHYISVPDALANAAANMRQPEGFGGQ